MAYAQPTTTNVIGATAIIVVNRCIPLDPHNPARIFLQVLAHYATTHLVLWAVVAVYRAL